MALSDLIIYVALTYYPLANMKPWPDHSLYRHGHILEATNIAYKKIVGYLFIYILQWTPVMVYVLIDTQQQTSMVGG
ncbi:unnamed protein product [Rhizophagus irregularis]|nr:unnamed protein product [Rhizophagus irregularis]